MNQKFIVDTLVSREKKKLDEKYAFPSTIKMAKQHLKAARLGPTNHVQELNKQKLLCPCCGLKINSDSLNLKDHTTALFDTEGFHVISCAALFFSFIKSVIIMLIIRFIIVDIFNIVTNLFQGKFCYGKCAEQFWSLASVIHKYDRGDLINITQILSFVTILVLLVYFMVIRKIQYQIYCNIDKENQTEDDFTIFIENIPILNFPQNHQAHFKKINFDYDGDLEKYFAKQIQDWLSQPQQKWQLAAEGSLQHDYRVFRENQNQKYNKISADIVASISLCYDISRIQKLRDLRKGLMQKYVKQIEEKGEAQVMEGMNQLFDTIPQQISFLNNAQINLSQSFVSSGDITFKATHFSGSAFLSFKYQHYRDFILNKYALDKTAFMMKGSNLRISKAPAPSDILWENLIITRQDRRNRVLTSFVILFVILFFAFGVLLGSDRIKRFLLKKSQEARQFDEDNNSGINWASMSVTLLTTVVTLSLNAFLQLFTYGLTAWERQKTKADEKLSLITKLLATQFLNTAMIYIVLSEIDNEDNNSLLSRDGLVYQISNLLVMSGFIQIGMNLVNIPALIRYFSLKIFYWGKGRHDSINQFQINLNKKFEYVQFDIAQRYSYYLLQLYTVSFYAYMIPICVPAVALIFVGQYWVDKLNLFKRSSLFYELDYSLSRNILKIAECSIVIFAFGAIYFSARIRGETGIFMILTLVISVVYALIVIMMPPSLERKIFQPYQTCEVYSYNQCIKAGKFVETYWRKNPATCLSDEQQITKRKKVKNIAADLLCFGQGSDSGSENKQEKQIKKGIINNFGFPGFGDKNEIRTYGSTNENYL